MSTVSLSKKKPKFGFSGYFRFEKKPKQKFKPTDPQEINLEGIRSLYPTYVKNVPKVHIDWKQLSKDKADEMSTQFIQRHQKYLDWSLISKHRNFRSDEVEQFHLLIQWKQMKIKNISNYQLEQLGSTELDWDRVFQKRDDLPTHLILTKGHYATCKIRCRHVNVEIAENFTHQLDWHWITVHGKIDKDVIWKFHDRLDFYWVSIKQSDLPIRFIVEKYEHQLDHQEFISKHLKSMQLPAKYLLRHHEVVDWCRFLINGMYKNPLYRPYLMKFADVIPFSWGMTCYDDTSSQEKSLVRELFAYLPKKDQIAEFNAYSRDFSTLLSLLPNTSTTSLDIELYEILMYELVCEGCDKCKSLCIGDSDSNSNSNSNAHFHSKSRQQYDDECCHFYSDDDDHELSESFMSIDQSSIPIKSDAKITKSDDDDDEDDESVNCKCHMMHSNHTNYKYFKTLMELMYFGKRDQCEQFLWKYRKQIKWNDVQLFSFLNNCLIILSTKFRDRLRAESLLSIISYQESSHSSWYPSYPSWSPQNGNLTKEASKTSNPNPKSKESTSTSTSTSTYSYDEDSSSILSESSEHESNKKPTSNPSASKKIDSSLISLPVGPSTTTEAERSPLFGINFNPQKSSSSDSSTEDDSSLSSYYSYSFSNDEASSSSDSNESSEDSSTYDESSSSYTYTYESYSD